MGKPERHAKVQTVVSRSILVNVTSWLNNIQYSLSLEYPFDPETMHSVKAQPLLFFVLANPFCVMSIRGREIWLPQK